MYESRERIYLKDNLCVFESYSNDMNAKKEETNSWGNYIFRNCPLSVTPPLFSLLLHNIYTLCNISYLLPATKWF